MEDIKRTTVEAWFAEQRKLRTVTLKTTGKQKQVQWTATTVNYFLQTARQFLRWAVANDVADRDPLQGMKPVRVEVRSRRRALTDDEIRRLLEATEKGKTTKGMTGRQRALLYRLALETGLRWNEIRTLTVASLNLTADPPTVKVEARYSKHRREDVLPLRADLASLLMKWTKHKQPASRVFRLWGTHQSTLLLYPDLATAKIPLKTPEGRVDFHALRHTFISRLARNGIHPSLAQRRARHSDINLALSRYTHVALGEQADALKNLPPLFSPAAARRENPTVSDDSTGRPTGRTGRPLGVQKRTKVDSAP